MIPLLKSLHDGSTPHACAEIEAHESSQHLHNSCSQADLDRRPHRARQVARPVGGVRDRIRRSGVSAGSSFGYFSIGSDDTQRDAEASFFLL